jgi:murein L,D-transpeptidase YafK
LNRKSYILFILSLVILLTGGSFGLAAEQIPDCLLCYRFGPEQHVLIVEKSSQSLFVYSNYNAEPIERFKITTGKNHGPKLEEGDMKTPEGIYFFRNILTGDELPKIDDYGEKAFTLNYPNPLDKLDNKNGSGIWLHGAFDTEKTSSPNNSRGCVVMKNTDLVKVSKYIFLNLTPLCIYNKIKYLDPAEIEKKRDRAIEHLKEWKTHWQDKNIDGYIGYYHPGYSYRGMDLDDFKTFKQRLNKRYRFIRVMLSDINLYGFKRYHVAIFNQLYISDQNHFYSKKIQYWGDPGDRAQIVDEYTMSLPQPTKFEVTKGNYITIEEYRKDFIKQMNAATISIAPAGVHLKNVSIFDGTVKLTIQRSGPIGDVRVIPLLKLEKDGGAQLKSLDGIALNGGVPRDYSRAVALERNETTLVLKKEPDFQLKSLTLVLVNRGSELAQVITYFINQ